MKQREGCQTQPRKIVSAWMPLEGNAAKIGGRDLPLESATGVMQAPFHNQNNGLVHVTPILSGLLFLSWTPDTCGGCRARITHLDSVTSEATAVLQAHSDMCMGLVYMHSIYSGKQNLPPPAHPPSTLCWCAEQYSKMKKLGTLGPAHLLS